MEGPSMEWQIQEYSSEENSGKVSWILNKGLKLGKNILVTGFVISSTPLVLPPLVVISAIGFACSIPYGLFLASYACTEKLMGKLLPRPTSAPPFIEFGVVPNDDDDHKVIGDEKEEENECFGEEQELVEDTRGGVELCEMRNEELDEGEVLEEYIYETISVEKHVKESVEHVDEIVEEDIGESLDEGDDKPLQRNGVLIEGMTGGEEEENAIEESIDKQSVEEVCGVVIGIEADEKSGDSVEEEETPFEVTSIVVESCQGSDIKEDDELVSETRDEGKTNNLVEEEKPSVEKICGGADKKYQEIIRHDEEVGMPFEDRNIYGNDRVEKPMREIEQKVEEHHDREIKLSAEIGCLSEKKIIDSVLETEKTVAEMSGTINVGSITLADQKPVIDKVAMLQRERAVDNVVNDMEQYFQLNREKEIVISNADAREIADESGFNLFDDKNEAGQLYSYANSDTAKADSSTESEQFSSNTTYDTDFWEVHVFTGKNESRNAVISSEKDISLASNKVLYNEEKIWEQIDSMRTILGYKATPHASCIEELKALYLFTGVEPPPSFVDPSDLVEINEKLRFLMSIIGVKQLSGLLWM